MLTDQQRLELKNALAQSRISPEQEAQTQMKQQQEALAEKEATLARPDVISLLKKSLTTIGFLKRNPKIVAKHFQISHSFVAEFAKEMAMEGKSIEDGLEEVAGRQAEERRELKDHYDQYKNAKGLDTLDFKKIHSAIMNDLTVEDKKKQALALLISQFQQEPKAALLLEHIARHKKHNALQEQIGSRIRTTNQLKKELDVLDKQMNDTSDPSKASKARVEFNNKFLQLNKLEQESFDTFKDPTKTPDMSYWSTVKVLAADMSVGINKGVEFYLPKAWSESWIKNAEDWRRMYDDVYGSDPDANRLISPRGTAVQMISGAIPGIVAWHYVAGFLGMKTVFGSKLLAEGTRLAASGVVDKALPILYQTIVNQNFGFEGLNPFKPLETNLETGEVYEKGALTEALHGSTVAVVGGSILGTGVKGLSYLFRQSVDAAQMMSLRLMNTSTGQRIFPVGSSTSVAGFKEKAATSLARKRLERMFSNSATLDKETGEMVLSDTAKMSLFNLAKEVETSPKRWHALGENVQLMIDTLEALGVKGLTHPKPSPELLYLEGLASGADKEVVEDVLKAYGKTVNDLNPDILTIMKSRDDEMEKLFNHHYFQNVVKKVQDEEVKLGTKGIQATGINAQVGKRVAEAMGGKLKTAVKEAVEKTKTKPKAQPPKVKPTVTSKNTEAFMKKLNSLPSSERKAFAKAHGIDLTKLGAQLKPVKVSNKFLSLLDKREAVIYDEILKKQGINKAVMTTVNHRVNAALMLIGNHLRKGRTEQASKVFRAAVNSLVALRKTDGKLVNKAVKEGGSKLRTTFEQLKLKGSVK